jgi:hypothetical protein
VNELTVDPGGAPIELTLNRGLDFTLVGCMLEKTGSQPDGLAAEIVLLLNGKIGDGGRPI